MFVVKVIHVLLGVLVLSFAFREYRWRRHSQTLSDQLDDATLRLSVLQTDVDRHCQRTCADMHLLQASNASCAYLEELLVNSNSHNNSRTTQGNFSNVGESLSSYSHTGSENIHVRIRPTPRLFDFNPFSTGTVVKMTGFVLCMLYEMLVVHRPLMASLDAQLAMQQRTADDGHGGGEDGAPTVLTHKTIRYCKVFLQRHIPGCNALLYLIIFVVSLLTLVVPSRFLDRDEVISQAIKIHLLWITSLPIALVTLNVVQLYPYLPAFAFWEVFSFKRESESPWRTLPHWLWVASRVFGCGNLYEFASGFLQVVISWTVSWPLRYYFFYSRDAFTASSAHGANLALHWVIFTAVSNLLTNMLAVFLLRSPVNLVAWFVRRGWDNPVFMAVASLIYGILALLVIIHSLWFLVVTRGWQTWYCCVIVLFGAIVPPVTVAFLSMHKLNTLIYRYTLVQQSLPNFLKSLKQAESKSKTTSESTAEDQSENREASKEETECEHLGRSLFEKSLDTTVLIYFFNEELFESTKKHQPQSETKGEAKENDGKSKTDENQNSSTREEAHEHEASGSAGENGDKLPSNFEAVFQSVLYFRAKELAAERDHSSDAATEDMPDLVPPDDECENHDGSVESPLAETTLD